MTTRSSRPVRRPEYWLILCSIAFAAVCFYGIRAAAVMGLACVTAMLTDLICLFLRGRPYKLVDLSNIGHAVVLTLLFPATIPYSIVILSTVFAVAVGTHVFGYRRDLLFPPAAVGYLFALICWKDEVLLFPEIGKHLALFGNDVEKVASFSAQFNEKWSLQSLHTEWTDLLSGTVPGPMGTGCILLLALGIVILSIRRQLNFAAVIGSLLFCCAPIVFGYTDASLYLTNMLLFSAIYFFADPALMPCRGLLSYFAAAATGLLTGFLIMVYHIEYAPVIAVILTCPLWRWMATVEQKQYAGAENAGKAEAVQE